MGSSGGASGGTAVFGLRALLCMAWSLLLSARRVSPPRVDPALEEDGRRRAVDAAPLRARAHTPVVEPPARLDGGEALVHHLDRDAGGSGQLLGEGERAAGGGALGAAHLQGKADEE